MSKINVGPKGDVQQDRQYRYKMDPLVTKIEGRGNGIKTVLLNVSEVAKQMRTEPQCNLFYWWQRGEISNI